MDGLKTWVDWEAILRSIAPDNRTAPPESPGYKPRTYKGVDRPPYLLLRATKALAVGRTTTGGAGCKDDPLGSRPPSSSRESDEDDRSGARTPPPTPVEPRLARHGMPQRPCGDSGGGAGSSSQRDGYSKRQYCTQECLLGLVTGRKLDDKCPNVSLYRGTDGDRHHHPIDHTTWLCLREQLGRTLDDGVLPLGKQGARGVAF